MLRRGFCCGTKITRGSGSSSIPIEDMQVVVDDALKELKKMRNDFVTVAPTAFVMYIIIIFTNARVFSILIFFYVFFFYLLIVHSKMKFFFKKKVKLKNNN
jgi:hypothetical protein